MDGGTCSRCEGLVELDQYARALVGSQLDLNTPNRRLPYSFDATLQAQTTVTSLVQILTIP